MEKLIVSINQKFTLQFVVRFAEHFKIKEMFDSLNYKFEFQPTTKENTGKDYPVASGRPEITFWIKDMTIEDSFIVQKLLRKI